MAKCLKGSKFLVNKLTDGEVQYFADKFFILIECCMYVVWTNVAEHRTL